MSFTTDVAHGVLHAAHNVVHPFTRGVGQSINIIAGNELPPVEALIHLGLTGMADELSVQEYRCATEDVARAFAARFLSVRHSPRAHGAGAHHPRDS